MQLQSIQNKIYEARVAKIMLDFDLATLYEVETRVLNQAIKRNIESFPEDFIFRLTKDEWESMSSQSVMMDLPKNRTGKYLPYAFTEQWSNDVDKYFEKSESETNEYCHSKSFCNIEKSNFRFEILLRTIERT